MEILVIMDESDKIRWNIIKKKYNEVISGQLAKNDLQKATAKFWHDMIEKYPILRNKQLSIDEANGRIYSWVGLTELRKSRLF